MDFKHIGFKIEDKLNVDFEEYRKKLSEKQRRKISKTELITEIIKERLERDFWID